jgi:hypothetical protein
MVLSKEEINRIAAETRVPENALELVESRATPRG